MQTWSLRSSKAVSKGGTELWREGAGVPGGLWVKEELS